MDEAILKQVFDTEVLSEETKEKLETAVKEHLAAREVELTEQIHLALHAEYAQKWVAEKEAMIENVMNFSNEKIDEYLAEAEADIQRFRDLEAEYAEKIVEVKHQMKEAMQADLASLEEKIDSFLELRLGQEFEILKEDLEVTRQNDFGCRMFLAFQSEFNRNFVDEESTAAQLARAEAELNEAREQIAALQNSGAEAIREAKLERILSPLSGQKRETMELVLAKVETDRLEEAYKHFIGRVLKEEAQSDAPLIESVVVTGNEDLARTPVKADRHAELKKLAGIS